MNETNGWTLWQNSSPKLLFGSDRYPIQIMREDWDKPVTCMVNNLSPETNVANLFWRPTGILIEMALRCGELAAVSVPK